MFSTTIGLARLTPALPDRDETGPVPANFSSILQSSFLANACLLPDLHQLEIGKICSVSFVIVF